MPAGILRPGDDEAQLRRAPGGLEEETFEGRLPVGAVGAEIAQIPAFRPLQPRVCLRIDGAVERLGGRGSVALLDMLQGRAAGEGQVDVVARDEIRREILEIAALELGERHGRVDVVEGRHAARGGLRPAADRDAVRHVGADDHGVRLRDGAAMALELGDAAVEVETAERRIDQVAVVGVPGRLALEEQDAVPALPRRP